MDDDSGTHGAVVIERTLEAPVALVWDMWTAPEHFAAWYGPPGATVPVAKMDVRVGGGRRVCMAMETPQGPMRMWFTGEYREVVQNRRLAYSESMSDEDGNVVPPSEPGMADGHPTTTEVIVELDDLGGRTRMVMTHVGVAPDSPGAAGWSMAFDKLAAYLTAHR